MKKTHTKISSLFFSFPLSTLLNSSLSLSVFSKHNDDARLTLSFCNEKFYLGRKKLGCHANDGFGHVYIEGEKGDEEERLLGIRRVKRRRRKEKVCVCVFMWVAVVAMYENYVRRRREERSVRERQDGSKMRWKTISITASGSCLLILSLAIDKGRLSMASECVTLAVIDSLRIWGEENMKVFSPLLLLLPHETFLILCCVYKTLDFSLSYSYKHIHYSLLLLSLAFIHSQ